MPDPAAALVFFGIGLIVGSFLNVCIHRLPRGESIVSPASRCPGCGRPIRWYDNVPVLSYVALAGKCRACGAPISVQYPLVETATGLVFAVTFLALGWTPLLVPRLLFGAAMVVLFAIDLEHQILPNVITLPGIVAGLLFSAVLPPGWRSALVGVALGGGVLWGIAETYYRVRGEEGLGMGDVKMLAMIGAFLGWQLTILTLVVSSFLGSLVGLGLIAGGKGTLKYALPFGTFLALGAVVAGLVGERVVIWYVSFY